MKNSRKTLYAMLAFALMFSVSCEKSSDSTETDAVILPPYESMAVDFNDFLGASSNTGKTVTTANKIDNNWLYPRIVVGIWNTALFTHLAVPVASFKSAFSHKALSLGDQKWQWSYTVDGFTGQYTARLTGELSDDVVIWKMYVTKTGVGAFEEFLWFSGEAKKDGSQGHWVLNESAERPHKMLRIDWKRENDEIGSIKYSWVRELNEEESDDLFKGSYLEYGLQEGDYNVFYTVHAYDENIEAFVDINIEWNNSNFNGRVKAPSYFEDEAWHCWDSNGDDIACE